MGLQLPLIVLTLLFTKACNIGEAARQEQAANATAAAASPWLRRLQKRRDGCRFQPWICRDRHARSSRWLCCRNRCVNVRTDPYNCGLCGNRCRFNRQCCHGACTNVMVNPFHCGNCQTRCPFGVRCLYGLCGYATPLPPFPFPFPPPPPRPPFPCPLPPVRPGPPYPYRLELLEGQLAPPLVGDPPALDL